MTNEELAKAQGMDIESYIEMKNVEYRKERNEAIGKIVKWLRECEDVEEWKEVGDVILEYYYEYGYIDNKFGSFLASL